jgi:hypothetical protein
MRRSVAAVSIVLLSALIAGLIGCLWARHARGGEPALPLRLDPALAVKLDRALTHLRELSAAERPYLAEVQQIGSVGKFSLEDLLRNRVAVNFETGEILRAPASTQP